MTTLTRPRTPVVHGHRRAHSSALDIVVTSPTREQELPDAWPLVEEKGPLLEEEGNFVAVRKGRRSNVLLFVLWIFSLAAASVMTRVFTAASPKASLGTFSSGYVTDLRMSKRH